MRTITTDEQIPKGFLESILRGNGRVDQRYQDLFRRLQQACYLEITDGKYEPLDARKRLQKQYREDGVVLFLGAGVSRQSGVPCWQKLAERVLERAGYACHGEIKAEIPSVYAQFELAASAMCKGKSKEEGQQEFLGILYDCLYGEEAFEALRGLLGAVPPSRKSQKEEVNWEDVATNLRNNRTLAAVGDLLVHEARKLEDKKTSQIHGVITVNTDNLLQIYCQACRSGEKRVLTTVDRASVGDHPDTISIYHLHGYLDARGENFLRQNSSREFMRAKNAFDLWPTVVFRESDYYRTIANPSDFVNHTPQSYFQRHNVLFIGTSLNDINIRRWLSSSFHERMEQRTKYLRERCRDAYDDVECEAKLESKRHFWLRTKGDLSDRIVGAIELITENLGVQIVWFDGYSEMQEYLGELNKPCAGASAE